MSQLERHNGFNCQAVSHLQGRWYARDMGCLPASGAGAGAVARLTVDALTALPQPLRLWSAEQPCLYTLVLELQDAGGRTLEAESCQVRCPPAAPRRRRSLPNYHTCMIH